MSDSAFSMLLVHTTKVNAQFIALQSQVLLEAHCTANSCSSGGGRGRDGGPPYRRRGPHPVGEYSPLDGHGLTTDRVSSCASSLLNVGSVKRKRGHCGGCGHTHHCSNIQGPESTNTLAEVESAEAVDQPGEYTILDFMRTLVERFALMLSALGGPDTVTGHDVDGTQEPAVKFAESAHDYPDYQMVVEHYRCCVLGHSALVS